jgi:phosphoribosylamine--glycine ligase
LDDAVLHWRNQSAVTVVLASEGYPESPQVGARVSLPAESEAFIYHAGTTSSDGHLLSSGGRVLTVTGIGSDLSQARNQAYDAISQINLDKSFYRSDIALTASKGK